MANFDHTRKCPLCGELCTSTPFLNRHIKEMHGVEGVVCPHCSKILAKNCTLSRHIEQVHFNLQIHKPAKVRNEQYLFCPVSSRNEANGVMVGQPAVGVVPLVCISHELQAVFGSRFSYPAVVWVHRAVPVSVLIARQVVTHVKHFIRIVPPPLAFLLRKYFV